MTRIVTLARRFWLPLTLAVAIAALILLLIWPGWAYQWQWTGFGASKSPSKTLWDWMQLFLIPLVLVVAAFLLNRAQQRREQTIAKANRAQDLQIAQDNRAQDLQIAQDNRAQDQKIADDRQQEAVLDAYLGQMATLLLDKKLREPQQQGARQLARAQTLTALRRLDGTRRGAVVEFLYEAQLIGYPARDEHGIITTHSPIIALWKADLSEADLRMANLGGADLGRADLTGADLGGADLRSANLLRANLGEATVTNEQLDDAWSLAGATLPDGTRLPDDFKGPLPPRKTSVYPRLWCGRFQAGRCTLGARDAGCALGRAHRARRGLAQRPRLSRDAER